MDYAEIFQRLNPDFFQAQSIRSLPKDWHFSELVMDLRKVSPGASPLPHPAGITFGIYHGALTALQDAVLQVDADWVQYFQGDEPTFCAYDGQKIAAFCSLSDMGTVQGLRIGGPGCVGTVPAYRRQGIGLEMVRLATIALQQNAYDLSWIHYTHLANWYARLGYRPVLRWNSSGILWTEQAEDIFP